MCLTSQQPQPPSPAEARPLAELALVALSLPVAAVALAVMVGVGALRGGDPGLVVALPFGLYLILAFALRRSAAAGPITAVVSIAVITAFPLYFPGERADALARGLDVIGRPFGVGSLGGLGRSLDGLLPAVSAGRRLEETQPLAAVAAPVAVPAPKLIHEDGVDHVVLPYEGMGSALHVPVELEGPDGAVAEVTMIFDTGASFTTLDMATLSALGVRVPNDAPEVRVHTAAGERSSRLVMLPRLWLGGLLVEGVTVGVCDACATDQDAGLLGLNVSGRFLTTVDQARREIVLRPRQGPDDRLADVRYWVALSATATAWPDGHTEAVVTVQNNAPRDIIDATVELRCDEVRTVTLGRIGAGERGQREVKLPSGIDCDPYEVALSAARW